MFENTLNRIKVKKLWDDFVKDKAETISSLKKPAKKPLPTWAVVSIGIAGGCIAGYGVYKAAPYIKKCLASHGICDGECFNDSLVCPKCDTEMTSHTVWECDSCGYTITDKPACLDCDCGCDTDGEEFSEDDLISEDTESATEE